MSRHDRGSKQCYKPEQLLDNLNIEFNASNSMIFMWNKYQIFIYNDFKFSSAAKVFTMEYQVHRLLVTDDYFLCLDTSGCVHVTALNFNEPHEKLCRSPHEPLDLGIKAWVRFSRDESLSLKYDSGTYYLVINKMQSDFRELKKVALRSRDSWPLPDGSRDTYLLKYTPMNKIDNCLPLQYKARNLNHNFNFVYISFDKKTIFACVFDRNMSMNTLSLIKLYTCPSEISSIEMTDTYMLVPLRMGSVLRFPLAGLCNFVPVETVVTHLNSALHKLVAINDTYLYTDGVTMCQADNVSLKNICFKQFFIKNVKDFIQCGHKIVCTTFSRMIYTFLLNDDESYLKPDKKEYSSVEELLGNAEYLQKIFQEIKKSEELSQKLSIEGLYIAAMSLAKRQEAVHKAIQASVTVCGSFEEVMRDNKDELTLTEDVSQYIEPSVYLFLVMVRMCSRDGGLSDIVHCIISNSEVELHVTISDEKNVLKTISIKDIGKNYLIPLHLEDAAEIDVVLRLVVRIPGTYNKQQKIWIELYRNELELTAGQFIRAKFNKHLICPKECLDDFENSIMSCSNMNRKHIQFINTSKPPTDSHVLYVRLPREFVTSDLTKYFKNAASEFMIGMLSSNDFLQCHGEAGFMVGKVAVALALVDDGFSNPRLKVMSGNLRVAASVRNFFASILYAENYCKPGKEFIDVSFFTSLNNMQEEMTECIESADVDEIVRLREKFEKDIIGMFPI